MPHAGNIGIFDSGLGGLWVLKHLREKLPEYTYVFLGDQAHVPYGTKSKEALFEYTTSALTFLYTQQNCTCVLLACNTTSSAIYDELRAWVQKEFPRKLLFGIVRPTVLAVDTNDPIVVFGTLRTIESHAYRDALVTEKKIPIQNIHEIVLTELASRIERGQGIEEYIASFRDHVPTTITTAILGCTHYGIVRGIFEKTFPHIKTWVVQEEVIPEKFSSYFKEKPEFDALLLHDKKLSVFVSEKSEVFDGWLHTWYGEDMDSVVVNL